MRYLSLTLGTCLGAVAALAVGSAYADDLVKMSENPADWVMPARTYDANATRPLKQINAGNVGKLQVAWTFSTGVLRGHEGAPLVIGARCTCTRRSRTSSTRSISTTRQDPLEV